MNSNDFACGLLAGWAQVIVGQPLDYIKVRIQTARRGAMSCTNIAKDIYGNHGLKGFYRGASSLLVGVSCTVASELVIY